MSALPSAHIVFRSTSCGQRPGERVSRQPVSRRRQVAVQIYGRGDRLMAQPVLDYVYGYARLQQYRSMSMTQVVDKIVAAGAGSGQGLAETVCPRSTEPARQPVVRDGALCKHICSAL